MVELVLVLHGIGLIDFRQDGMNGGCFVRSRRSERIVGHMCSR